MSAKATHFNGKHSKRAYILVQQNRPVIDERLAVEEVVAREQQVPGECAEPGQIIHSVNGMPDVDDLAEALELDRQYLTQDE